MWTYVEIDGKLYVTKEDYLNAVKYYENSLSAERDGAKEDIKELREKIGEIEEENKVLSIENAKLKDRIITDENFEEKLDKENKKLKEELENTKKEFEQYKQNYNIEKDKQLIFLMTWRRY